MEDRKARLLEEFNNSIAPQKAGLAARIPQLFSQYYEPPKQLPVGPRQILGAAGAAAVPGKRPAPGGGDARPSQRVRTGPADEVERKVDAMFKEISNLIARKLWGKKECAYFKEPVDPVKLRIPDYFNYIKHPMDLGTVKNKLARREYKTPLEVCEDVRLVWRNCATYNQIGNPVRTAGDMMSDVWERAWAESRIEEQWNEITYQRDPSGKAVPYKVNQLNAQLKSAVQSVPAPGDAGAHRQMSEIEKRKLSVQLAELQGDQLPGVLDIVQSDMASIDPSGQEEVELDMDALPHSTLWKLKAYVDGLLHRHRVPAAGAPNKTAPMALASAPSASMPVAVPGQASAGVPTQEHAAQAVVQAPLAAAAVNGEAAPAPSAVKSEMGAPKEEPSESGSSDTERDSPQEVKGSTMDDPHAQNAAAFVKDGRQLVDESVTNPREQSTILKDRAAVRKPEVQVNAANWNVMELPEQPQGGQGEEAQEGGEDEIWENFKTMEEQKRKQAEEQKKLKEAQEEELRKKKAAEEEEAARLRAEQEARERALKEEEERIAAEQQRARMEQCKKEVDELQAKQGTANLVQGSDIQGILSQVQPTGEAGLAAAGLVYKNDDEDVNFDDD